MSSNAPAVTPSTYAAPEPETPPNAGGWQAISSEESAAVVEPPPVESAAEAQIDEGWTSAYDEQQTVDEILGAARYTPATSIVEPEVPTTSASFFQSSESTTSSMPDAAIPDMAIPDTAIPDTAIPDMAIPDTAIPDMAIPDMAIPDVAIPDVAMPDATIPDVAVPDVSSDDLSKPDMAPEVAAPEAVASIQRDAAWRNPNETPIARAETLRPTDAPAVVDLAVTQSQPTPAQEPSKSRLSPILLGLIGLIVLVGLAFLIISLLSGDGNSSAVGSEAPSTTIETAAPAEQEDGLDDVSVFELRAGDCIVGDIGSGQITQVTRVDCEQEHQFEVYREVLIDSSITTFDEAEISSYAEDVCSTSLDSYIPPDDPRGLSFKFLQPTEDSWNQEEEPDRVVTCLLFDDDEPLIGRANEQ